MTDREGIAAFQRFLRELWREVEAAVAAGKSLEDTLASVDLTEDEGYEARSIPFVMRRDRDLAIRRAYGEATGAMRAAPVPRSASSRWDRGIARGRNDASRAVAMEDRSS